MELPVSQFEVDWEPESAGAPVFVEPVSVPVPVGPELGRVSASELSLAEAPESEEPESAAVE